MDICLLSKMYPPIKGGSGMYAYEIANALGKRGHNVDVYTQSTDEEMELPIHENVTVERICKARRYLVTFETLYYSFIARQTINSAEYDIIHGTLMPASTILLPELDRPTVLTSHSFAPSNVGHHTGTSIGDYLLRNVFHPMNRVMDESASEAADRVIAISSEMRLQMIREYQLNPGDIEVIHHGVDTSRFHPREEAHEEVNPERTTALFVGRLVDLKGADLAIKGVAEAGEDVELLIIGSGRQEQRLHQLVEERGLEDRVKFLGHVSTEHLPSLYSSSDVNIFTSQYEGFGLVFLEAMACGTPVIGTEVGGVPDLINDGENGFLVSRDPSEIGQRITYLHENPSELERLSQAAYVTASARTWDYVAKQVEEVYYSLR